MNTLKDVTIKSEFRQSLLNVILEASPKLAEMPLEEIEGNTCKMELFGRSFIMPSPIIQGTDTTALNMKCRDIARTVEQYIADNNITKLVMYPKYYNEVVDVMEEHTGDTAKVTVVFRMCFM